MHELLGGLAGLGIVLTIMTPMLIPGLIMAVRDNRRDSESTCHCLDCVDPDWYETLKVTDDTFTYCYGVGEEVYVESRKRITIGGENYSDN